MTDVHPLRVYVPGLSYHVIQRGHNRSAIFDQPCDFEFLVALVRYAAHRYATDVHAFAVMNNHYHLIATPTHNRALARTMEGIDAGYTRYYNRKHGRTGTAWNARYKAKPIEDETYWLTCLRYVELNPVSAKLVRAAELYRWTSFRVHAFGEFNDWLVPHALYTALGDTPTERQMAYRAMCPVSDTVVDLPQCLTP